MIKRAAALPNTFSGAAGEARVAAELVRSGLRVAKPYWADDVDRMLLVRSQHVLIPIAVQVKSLQLGPASDETSHHSSQG